MFNLLSLDNIKLSGEADNRKAAINEASELLVKSGFINEGYIDKIFQREKSFSTYIGNGLAIPHSIGVERHEKLIKKSGLAFVRYDEAIDWDGDKVEFVIPIISTSKNHMDILCKLSSFFSKDANIEKLRLAKSKEEIQNIFISSIGGV